MDATRAPLPQLLARDLGEHKVHYHLLMTAAYRAILGEKSENYGLWHHFRDDVTQHLRTWYQREGWEAAPLFWASLWDRVGLPAPSSDPNAHMRFVEALMTDYTEVLCDHIVYRQEKGGNVHIRFKGPTGMGKSSCAVALANWFKPYPAGRLEEYLNLDVDHLMQKTRNKEPGDTIVQDEYVGLAGEGARTTDLKLANLQDTMRASRINLFICTPDGGAEHSTTQAELEVIMWKPGASLFLLWTQGEPRGVVAIPWMPPHLWAQYEPWKKANTERMIQGQFRETNLIARLARDRWRNENLVKYLLVRKTPKPNDFKMAIRLFNDDMMPETQQEAVAEFMSVTAMNFKEMEPHYEEWFHTEPPQGLRRVAIQCYKE